MAEPMVSSTVAAITTGAEPQIVLAQWARGAKTPMQSTGRRVSTPSQALLRCSSASICGTSGGTPAIAGRRFAATATSATMSTQDRGSHGKARALVRVVDADDAARSGTVLDMAPPLDRVGLGVAAQLDPVRGLGEGRGRFDRWVVGHRDAVAEADAQRPARTGR